MDHDTHHDALNGPRVFAPTDWWGCRSVRAGVARSRTAEEPYGLDERLARSGRAERRAYDGGRTARAHRGEGLRARAVDRRERVRADILFFTVGAARAPDNEARGESIGGLSAGLARAEPHHAASHVANVAGMVSNNGAPFGIPELADGARRARRAERGGDVGLGFDFLFGDGLGKLREILVGARREVRGDGLFPRVRGRRGPGTRGRGIGDLGVGRCDLGDVGIDQAPVGGRRDLFGLARRERSESESPKADAPTSESHGSFLRQVGLWFEGRGPSSSCAGPERFLSGSRGAAPRSPAPGQATFSASPLRYEACEGLDLADSALDPARRRALRELPPRAFDFQTRLTQSSAA